MRQTGVQAHAIGHDLFAPEAHVAVVAYQRDERHLCDLGDQWILPAPLDAPDGTYATPISGLFPGARVQFKVAGPECTVTYHRPSGKTSRQRYSLAEIHDDQLWSAAEHSQGLLRKPLCETRVPAPGGVAHWEFSNGSSFLNTGRRRRARAAGRLAGRVV